MSTIIVNLLAGLYRAAWWAAMPLVARSPRMAAGWEQRTLATDHDGPYDVWIQSSSGGESLLANMVVSRLADMAGEDRPLKILATAGTREGIESLEKGLAHLSDQTGGIDVSLSYFPLDAPRLMERAFDRIKPRLAVVIETELWPGYLISARRKSVPVLVINGRMSEKSFGFYKHFHWFFSTVGPNRVLAISDQDGERFARVVGQDKVSVMNNIKFDRITPRSSSVNTSPVTANLPPNVPFVLLGSIRREEEEMILTTIRELLSARKNIVVGLFPKHIARAAHWIKELENSGITALKRSETGSVVQAGCVIVWDVFGELANAYDPAAAAFVGGSLANLGGQNFLEPLAFGLRPIIGPYWENFAWVGRRIVEAGLVREVENEHELSRALLADLDATTSREETIARVRAFFGPLQGGTRRVCNEILSMIENKRN